MFTPAGQPSFTFSVQGVSSELRVLAFTGVEALNQPFDFELQLISEHSALDLSELLHKPAFLRFCSEGVGIHGIVDRIAQGDSGRRFTRYDITLRPRLARLAHRINQRIFQNLSVPDIITTVLRGHGILADAHHFHLGFEYPPRDYCVQYDESDLHFIQRLCEEEGLSYHFQHSSDDHHLVFGDDQTVFPKLASVSYQQDSGQVADHSAITRLAVRLETRTTRATRRDHDFKNPRLLLESHHSTELAPDLEDYDYPGRFSDRDHGRLLATRAVERHRADYRMAEGRGDVARLASGHFMPLIGHSRDEYNDLWLLTSVRHEGKQPQVLEEALPSASNAHKDDFHQGYRNAFSATPWEQHFRPALRHGKRRIRGRQRALVTGPAGEEIHCDSYGRVKVQFFWDREGAGDDHTSCWLRVSSAWAGARYGGVAVPRVGMEVLVGFLEGDPDQPLVTGCLYHRDNTAPYPLPASKTRSVFKTLSSPNGEGFNELRIEDKQGQEQIFINAQRDWEQRIVHDQKIRVGHQRHDTVEADSYSEIKAEEHKTVDHDSKAECYADDHLSIAVSQHLKVATDQFVEAGTEIHLSSGQKVVLEAGASMTLMGGGSWIQIDASGVAMSGTAISLNGGGIAGLGSAVAALLPGLLRQATTASAGAIPLSAARPLFGIIRECGKHSGGACMREDCKCLN
nr:type VI secretion system tip protein VgrG [uncultured Pseudomonas sp.]